MKLPKIPIDHSKAGTGEAPFDGKHVILHINSGYNIKTVEAYFYHLLSRNGRWAIIGGSIENEEATHYSPMPEFVTSRLSVGDVYYVKDIEECFMLGDETKVTINKIYFDDEIDDWVYEGTAENGLVVVIPEKMIFKKESE